MTSGRRSKANRTAEAGLPPADADGFHVRWPAGYMGRPEHRGRSRQGKHFNQRRRHPLVVHAGRVTRGR